MPSSTFAKVATTALWRREFDFAEWSATMLPSWLSLAKLVGVRIEWVEPNVSSTIWSDSDQLGQIFEGLLRFVTESAFPEH